MYRRFWPIIFAIFFGLALTGVILWSVSGVKAETNADPTGFLEVVVTDHPTHSVEAIGSYANAIDYGACLYWGDEEITGGDKTCFPGTEGPFVKIPHQYDLSGEHTALLIITGTESTVTFPSTFRIYDLSRAIITATVTNNSTFEGSVSGEYSEAYDWGSCITDWGYEGDSNQPVCFPGSSGVFTDVTHVWPGFGSYIITFEVNGPAGTRVVTDTIGFFTYIYLPIVMKSPPEPHGTLDVILSNPTAREIMVSGSFANSLDWGACVTWGDNEPEVCFPGTDGTFTDVPHQYAQGGNYTVTLTVNGITGTIPDVVPFGITIP